MSNLWIAFAQIQLLLSSKDNGSSYIEEDTDNTSLTIKRVEQAKIFEDEIQSLNLTKIPNKDQTSEDEASKDCDKQNIDNQIEKNHSFLAEISNIQAPENKENTSSTTEDNDMPHSGCLHWICLTIWH